MNYFFNIKRNAKKNGGFLLVELIVSIFIFSLFMTIAVGSIISLLDANRKTQSLKSVMNNLNLALDSMTKEMAVGTDYHCGSGGNTHTPADCLLSAGGGQSVTFLSNEDIDGDGSIDDYITYTYHPGSSGYIDRSISTVDNNQAVPMTAAEINITNMTFFVTGTNSYGSGDTYQPKIIIWIDGSTTAAPRDTASSFHIQTAVSQRIPDNI